MASRCSTAEPRRRPGPALVAATLVAHGLASVAVAGGIRFREASAELGIDFVHRHGGTGEFYMPETMGSGVAVLDYDGDGDEDVLLIDSGRMPGHPGPPGRTALFRNDGTRFVDVTDRSGIRLDGYGMGVTAGDVDGDGDADLYVTAFGANQLFENLGDGTFRDVTASAGVGDPSWSASAAFADTDLDGDLDLYVTNYVDFSLDNNPVCGDQARGLRSYCHPDSFNGLPDRFYRNRGDGTFEDATIAAGFAAAAGAGLGVIFGDVNDDGRVDLYVANDMTPNFLFLGGEDGVFVESALMSGAALGQSGEPEAGMGVAMGDLDGDDRAEIFVTHLDRQTNALYSSQGGGLFLDRRFLARVAEPSVNKVGFGAAFADVDLDGDLDIVVANGHIIHNIEEWGTGGRYRQANQVLENDGAGRFAEPADHGMDVVRSSRGLAVGDLDRDGAPDVVISNSNEPVEVYLNETTERGRWLAVRPLAARGAAVSELGTRVAISGDGVAGSRELRSGSSYLSQDADGAWFGLGDAARVDVEIERPGGGRRVLRSMPADRCLLIGG